MKRGTLVIIFTFHQSFLLQTVVSTIDCTGRQTGFYADPDDCRTYYGCRNGARFTSQCPAGQAFQPSPDLCDLQQRVGCNPPPPPNRPVTCAGRPPGSMFRNRADCSTFYWCVNGRPLLRPCPVPLVFNSRRLICDWAFNVNCNEDANPLPGTNSGQDIPFDCRGRSPGYYADPNDCTKFHRCISGQSLPGQCPVGMAFKPTPSVCDPERTVGCQSTSPTSPTTTTTTTTTRRPTTTRTTTTTTTTTTTRPTTTTPTTTRPTTTRRTTTRPTTTRPTTTRPTTTPRTTTTTRRPPPSNNPSCVGRPNGSMFPHPSRCSSFYWCVNNRPLLRNCPRSLVFNPLQSACDWPFNVDCIQNPVPTNPPPPAPGPGPAQPPGSQPQGGCQRRVCYYTNWSHYRRGDARFLPEMINTTLCTHVVVAFATLSGTSMAASDPSDESTPGRKGFYQRINDLKKIKPDLKTLISVGGWNLGTAPFTQMAATQATRQAFADQSMSFIKSRGFDGLDIDWEYPANRGSPRGDREKFTLLLKQLRETYDRNVGSPLLLSIAVSGGKFVIDTGYEVPQISRYADFISLNAYDFHGSWESVTGHHSGLFARNGEIGPAGFLNTAWAADYWVRKGCPRDKLVLGVPTYGRTFTLRSASSNGPGAPAVGPGTAGEFTNEEGFLAYYEICTMRASASVQQRIEEQKVPYLARGDQWVGYEDPQSIREKVRHARQEGYGGIMTWSLPLDDFSGKFCGEGQYPLWSAVTDECLK